MLLQKAFVCLVIASVFASGYRILPFSKEVCDVLEKRTLDNMSRPPRDSSQPRLYSGPARVFLRFGWSLEMRRLIAKYCRNVFN
ncbi:hypothetical protein QR680_016182 [Steinernema hermaphroditum]|uniref:Secreted protein n=1 Tax=Steinernema hermaphroditum TaxID=289476 RepID=A0AA39HAK9_9BILA|nr:hypothetical protein QR680_016182 [Steinernema hermaphroditum]